MEIQGEKSGFNNKLVRNVGCFGCLTYIILFFTSAGVITSLGYDTLWVVPFMGVFVFIWLCLFLWALQKSKK